MPVKKSKNLLNSPRTYNIEKVSYLYNTEQGSYLTLIWSWISDVFLLFYYVCVCVCVCVCVSDLTYSSTCECVCEYVLGFFVCMVGWFKILW